MSNEGIEYQLAMFKLKQESKNKELDKDKLVKEYKQFMQQDYGLL